MNYNVFALDEFKKNAKKLSKRYKKIKLDISELVNQPESDPYMGTHLFNNCYKIRISNSYTNSYRYYIDIRVKDLFFTKIS